MKKLMMKTIIIIIISFINKSQETMVFHGHQKLTSAIENNGQKSDGRLQI